MCLIVSRARNKRRTKVYKFLRVLELDDGGEILMSPFQYSEYTIGECSEAEDSVEKEEEPNEGIINSGAIHVYTSLKKAARDKRFYAGNGMSYAVVVCEVSPEDWVADGHFQEACYKKVKPVKRIL